MTKAPAWKNYQIEVAKLLSHLGFDTEVEQAVEGARGGHDIDVVARITVAGISQLWIVECKHWKRPVPKERALTFLSIVQDVGADRGLLFSESGFQAGAVRATAKTNVSLTSIADLKSNVQEELLDIKVAELDRRAETLGRKILDLWHASEPGQAAVRERYIGPLDSWFGTSEPSEVMTRLSQMRRSLEDGRFGEWPVTFWVLEHDMPFFVNDWDGLFYVAEEIITTCERIYEHMMDVRSTAMSWKEFQSPEFVEMIGRIIRRGSTAEDG